MNCHLAGRAMKNFVRATRDKANERLSLHFLPPHGPSPQELIMGISARIRPLRRTRCHRADCGPDPR